MIYQCGLIMATRRGGWQNPFVPALDAGPQKSKPYQSDVYMISFNAIPRQAREQDSFDIPLIVYFPKSPLVQIENTIASNSILYPM